MKPLALVLLVLAPLAPEASAQDSTATGSWLARAAATIRPMPMRWEQAPIRLPRVVLDLRGPAPPAPRFGSLPAVPWQERRRRKDDE